MWWNLFFFSDRKLPCWVMFSFIRFSKFFAWYILLSARYFERHFQIYRYGVYKHQWNTRWAFTRKYHRCYGYIIKRAFHTKRVFSHDVTAAMLVSQNNETAAMLVSQTSRVRVELFSYANAFFCSINLHRCWPREWKHSIKVKWFGSSLVFI